METATAPVPPAPRYRWVAAYPQGTFWLLVLLALPYLLLCNGLAIMVFLAALRSGGCGG